jgi:beta-lactamase regulating signal transducer with metallopeptidase domain
MNMAGGAEFGWVPLLVEYLIKSMVVLTLALILVVLLRRRSASLRHLVLSLSLAGLLMIPVLPYFGGGWETSLLPGGASAPSIRLTGPEAAKAADHGRRKEGSKGVLLPFSHSYSAPDTSSPTVRSLVGISGSIVTSALPIVWSAGLILLLLRLAAGLFGAFRLTCQGETVRDPGWRVLLERFLAAIRLQRKVRLKSHRAIRIPLTCGFIRPVVLIPDDHEAWTEEQRSSTLIHELSHIKRADFLVMVLVRLSLAVFWLNPLSWVVFRRLKNEQEEACDELVLRTGIKPSTYAASLLFFKSAAGDRLGHFAALLGLFGFGRSAFNERLAAILKQKWTFQEVKMKTKILVFCAVILAVALIGLARPSASVAEEDVAAVGSPAAAGPDVLNRPVNAEGAGAQAVDRAQEQKESAKAQEQEGEKRAQAQEEKTQQAEKKPPVVVTIKEGDKHQHEIIITEGDKVKTITVDGPIIIKGGQSGKTVYITRGGRAVKVLKGDAPHLELKADKVELIEAGKLVKVGKDGTKVYIVAEPHIKVGKAVKVAPHVTVATVKTQAIASPHVTLVSEDRENEIREKLHAIRGKLKEVEEKKLELRELDKALADLEKELEKMSRETSRVKIKHVEEPAALTIQPEKADEEAAQEVEPDVGMEVGEPGHEHGVTVVAKEEGSFLLSYTLDLGAKSREVYERVVARVKKDLPEGFTVEPEFEEESGVMTLKINGPLGQAVPHDLAQKLADGIRDETKEKNE